MSAARPGIEQVVASLDDETLFVTMLSQFTETFPSFVGAPARVRAARDRLVRLARSAPDMLDVLKAQKCSQCMSTEPDEDVCDACRLKRAAIAKAKGSR